jgi:hypothetical protein
MLGPKINAMISNDHLIEITRKPFGVAISDCRERAGSDGASLPIAIILRSADLA